MSAKVVSGRSLASTLRAELKAEVERLKSNGKTPGLGVVLVGADPASASYVTAKERACEELGIYSDDNRVPADISTSDLLDLVQRLNADARVDGILVQLPLPDHIDSDRVLLSVDPDKDVDGFHPENVGRLVLGQKAFLPCTPHAVVQMLNRSGVEINGSDVVVVGRSNIVGKPLANILLQRGGLGNATVTICHTGTRNLEGHTRRAEILIAAAGQPEMITADMVTQGAVVIDVGVNRVNDATKKRGYRLVGDVAFGEVSEKASVITPVPGGVGPMTITMLLFNTIEAAKRGAGA